MTFGKENVKEKETLTIEFILNYNDAHLFSKN